LLTWEERIVEDEQIVLARVCRAVDWSKRFQTPPLAIRVNAKLMPVAGREPLAKYEKALSSLPLECRYVWEDEPVPPGVLHMIDAREPFAVPTFTSSGGKLPDAFKARMPLSLPPGFSANYSWSEDRRTLLAFIRRVAPLSGHHPKDGRGRGAGGEGTPQPKDEVTDGRSLGAGDATAIRLQNFPAEDLSFQLLDLAKKDVVRQGTFRGATAFEIPESSDEWFLLVSGRIVNP
jgi:hypothetical protein